jgi:hypothetical protein
MAYEMAGSNSSNLPIHSANSLLLAFLPSPALPNTLVVHVTNLPSSPFPHLHVPVALVVPVHPKRLAADHVAGQFSRQRSIASLSVFPAAPASYTPHLAIYNAGCCCSWVRSAVTRVTSCER